MPQWFNGISLLRGWSNLKQFLIMKPPHSDILIVESAIAPEVGRAGQTAYTAGSGRFLSQAMRLDIGH
jgi:hypothetical protein